MTPLIDTWSIAFASQAARGATVPPPRPPTHAVSAASGNWSAGATWVDGVVPGDGDTFTLSPGHIVTTDTDVTIGAGGATATLAGAVSANNGPGKLVLGPHTFTMKGDVRLFGHNGNGTLYRRLEAGPGSRVVFDATGGDRYIINGSDTANDNPILYIVGASGNRAQFSQIGANKAGIKAGTNTFFPFTIDYATFTGLKADPAFAGQYSRSPVAYPGFDATMGKHTKWTGCGEVRMGVGGPLDADAPWELSGKIINSIGANGALSYDPGASTVCTVANLFVAGPVWYLRTTGMGVDRFHDCVFLGTNGVGANTGKGKNIVYGLVQTANGGSVTHGSLVFPSAAPELPTAFDDDIDDCYFLFTRRAMHNYYLSFNGARNRLLRRCIFELRAVGSNGGGSLGPGVATPAVSTTVELERCIRLRNVRDDHATTGRWMIESGATSNFYFKERH